MDNRKVVGRGHRLDTLTEVVWGPETLHFSGCLSPEGGCLPCQRHLSLSSTQQTIPRRQKNVVFFTIFEPRKGFSVRPENPLPIQPIRLRGYPRPTSGNLLDQPYCNR